MADERKAETTLSAAGSVLGSLLIDPEHTAGLIFHGMRPEDFPSGELRTVFTAARELFFEGSPIDVTILADRLGHAYESLLADLMTRTPTAAHVEAYMDIARQDSQLARVRDLASQLLFEQANVETCRDLIGKAAQVLSDNGAQDDAISMAAMMDAFIDRHKPGKRTNYLPWGIPKLDKELLAELGDFIVIGGYPSAGKTMLSVQAALTLARKGYRVGYFSLETSPKGKLADRIMAHVSRVPLRQIKTNDLTEPEMLALTHAAEEIYSLPIEFYRAGGMTVNDIQARTLARRYQVIIIDYLQLIQAGGRDLREQVTAISKGLHTLCQTHGVCVIALSQLSRPEKDKGKLVPPSMSSLRESGQIEQDADLVMLIYKEDPNDTRSRRYLKIAKNKEGELDRMILDFDGPTQTLTESKSEARREINALLGTGKIAAARAHNSQAPMAQDSLFHELAEAEGGEIPF